MSQITFEIEKKPYTLEYTLKTAAMAERDGLVIDQLGDKPGTMIPLLVHWAFYRHHKGITKEMTSKIYRDGIKDKKGFISALMDMYADAVNALIDADDEDEEGNANWTLS